MILLTDTVSKISNSWVGTAEHTLRQRSGALGINTKARCESSCRDSSVERQQRLKTTHLRQWPETSKSIIRIESLFKNFNTLDEGLALRVLEMGEER